MRPRILTCISAMTLFAGLAAPIRLAAQEQRQQQKKEHTRYRLVDLGTLGGPQSYETEPARQVNNHGTVIGWADTSTPDPFPSACFNGDCFVSHAFKWQNGVLTDLGSLAAGWSSSAGWITDSGLIGGISQNGLIDPLIGTPEIRSVLWKDGQIIDLGTLGGYESLGSAINNVGQYVGGATNVVSDPFSGFGTQVRAFLWENGVMQDLGTLGGPDAFAPVVNERGQIAGQSYTNSTPNPITGLPTLDPFLWQNGTMLDLGTLGGTSGYPNGLNNRGQVVGQSNLAGDLTFHPFLWTKPGPMQDLGTLGGNNGAATGLNDAGEIVGNADLPGDQVSHAFVWKNGVMTDLGMVPGDGCSIADGINSKGQVVGRSLACDGSVFRAFLWENGGPMIDLNTLIPPDSPLFLRTAYNINDRGEIVGLARLKANFSERRAYLLIPCVEDSDGCQTNAEATTVVTQNNSATVINSPAISTQDGPTPGEIVAASRARLMRRYRGLGVRTPE